jgi:hypothetical protein
MNVSVYRNLSAIRFIRCVAPVPGAKINAGGAAVTLCEALAKCESEVIERGFEIRELWPAKIFPTGIAAHLNFEEAKQRALHESAETLCLKQIALEGTFHSRLHLKLPGFTVGLAKTEIGYLCLIRGKFRGRTVAAHSAAPRLFGAFLKAWEEYRGLHFFKPSADALRTFTKAHYLFTTEGLSNLQFMRDPTFIYRPQLSALKVDSVERDGRKIVYFHEKNKEKS